MLVNSLFYLFGFTEVSYQVTVLLPECNIQCFNGCL
jgi:hypothetical protein